MAEEHGLDDGADDGLFVVVEVLDGMDVVLLHAEVHVRVQAQQITGKGRVVKEPKSDAGVRSAVLPAVVIDAVDHHLGV